MPIDRQEIERRLLILEVLRDNGAIDRPLMFNALHRTLDTLGQSVSPTDLRRLLQYLNGRNYDALTTRKQLGGIKHSNEHSDDIMLIKLTPDGLDFVEAASMGPR